MFVADVAPAVRDWLTSSVGYGSLPDWLAGLGAVAALIWARKAARAANAQIVALEEAQYRAQANQVVGWVEELDGKVVLNLRNTSNLPCYTIFVAVVHGDWVVYTDVRKLLPPTGPESLLTDTGATADAYDGILWVRMTFTDASGRNWWRHGHGSLEEVSDDEQNRRVAEVQAQALAQIDSPGAGDQQS